MGLLDGNLGIDLTDPKLALAAGLLGGTGNFGANLGRGLLGAQASAQAKNQFGLVQQNAERANRANDLQQVGALYKMALQRDMMQQAQDEDNRVPHTTDPMLATLQAKMSELAGLPPLAGGARPVATPGAPQAPSQPFQYGSSPGLQGGGLGPIPGVPSGQAPQFQQLPQPQGQRPQAQRLPMLPQQGQPQGQQEDVQAQLARYRRQGDMFAFAGMNPVAENRYKLSVPQVSKGVSFNNATGMPMYGMIDNIPTRFDGQGNPTVVPNQIGDAIAQRAGAVSGAQAAATSPYKLENVTDASGRTVPKFLPQLPGYPGGQSPQPQQSQQIPAAVQAAADRGQPFEAAQAPGGPVQFNRNPGQPQDPWATIPRIQVPQGLGQSTYGKGIAEKQATAAQETAQELGTNASAAAQRIAINNQAKDLVDKADTGWMATHLGEFRNILGTLGVKSAADMAANDAILAKDLTNTALQKGKQLFGSRFTQSEVGIMLTRANPSPEMQKVAIKFLLDTDNATQEYATQQAQDFGRYYQSGGDPFQFKGWYASKFPLTKQLQSIPLGNEPRNIDDLVKHYYRPQ